MPSFGFQAAKFEANGATGLVFAYGVQDGGNINRRIAFAPDESSPVWSTSSVDTVPLASSTYPPTWGVGLDELASVVFRYPVGETDAEQNYLAQRTFDGEALTIGAESLVVSDAALGSLWFRQPTCEHVASVGSVFASTANLDPLVSPSLPSVWFAVAGSPPPPPGTTPNQTFPPYGTRLLIRCPNYFDYCLHAERSTLAKIGMLRLLFPDFKRMGAKDPYTVNDPYTVIPTQGVQFHKQGAILLPATEEVNTLVMSFRVPTGYDGSAWGILGMYTGSGYQEGSDDIVYRFRFNLRYVRNLGDIHNTMGGLSQYFPIEEHERLFSQQTISMFVYLGPGALSRLDPTKRIIMGMEGWLYPRGGEVCNPYRKKL